MGSTMQAGGPSLSTGLSVFVHTAPACLSACAMARQGAQRPSTRSGRSRSSSYSRGGWRNRWALRARGTRSRGQSQERSGPLGSAGSHTHPGAGAVLQVGYDLGVVDVLPGPIPASQEGSAGHLGLPPVGRERGGATRTRAGIPIYRPHTHIQAGNDTPPSQEEGPCRRLPVPVPPYILSVACVFWQVQVHVVAHAYIHRTTPLCSMLSVAACLAAQ